MKKPEKAGESLGELNKKIFIYIFTVLVTNLKKISIRSLTKKKKKLPTSTQ